ncbi:hypothetical protein GUJ93_ZPchr0001g31751 [Zizania palustris]|uniref:Uncharacterized protein n=1 Tax=Zizania palustris TaxID=103762 RepID=A0A8J5RGH8_ZIZPA|nr:hypothetical protein GUJ93_ZPchr0001g31751 [Zizania palustris]
MASHNDLGDRHLPTSRRLFSPHQPLPSAAPPVPLRRATTPLPQVSLQIQSFHRVMPPLRRSPRIMELNKNKEANVTANQITASRPMIREANLRRTPPHLLNQERRKQINIGGSTSMSHQLDCSAINPTQTSYQIHNPFGLSSTSFGNFSFPHGNHGAYNGVVPRDGRNIAYLSVPMFSPSTPNNSIPSGSLINEGHLMRPLVGENNPSRSNPRAAFSQLNHQLPSWYTVAPVHRTSQNNVDFFGHQQLAQYQCNQPVRPLPSYQRSQITTTNTSNAGTSHLQSILGKRPAESESFFHLDGGDDMATVARGPQCSLDTDNLLSLYQSVGTPEFLATSERVLASGRSLYEPTHAAASVAAPAHFPVTRETATQKSQACSKSTMQHRP